MKLYYRYGWLFGRQLSRMGVRTKIRLDVIRDDEAGVFVGTSPDLQGLIVEADTLERVLNEASELIPDLVKTPSDLGKCTYTDVHVRKRLVHA